jgi:hypothetical protein
LSLPDVQKKRLCIPASLDGSADFLRSTQLVESMVFVLGFSISQVIPEGG